MALVLSAQSLRAASGVYARQGAVLRRALEDAVDDVWDDVDWDDDDDAGDEDVAWAFARRVAPLSRAAQRGLVRTLSGYLTVVARVPLGNVDLDEVLEEDDEGWRAPVFATWGALGAGAGFAAAVAAGQRLAERKAQTELAIAQVRAMSALTSGTRIRGYRRVLAGDGCQFCVGLADEVVASGDAMEIHPGCNCSVEPVLS